MPLDGLIHAPQPSRARPFPPFPALSRPFPPFPALFRPFPPFSALSRPCHPLPPIATHCHPLPPIATHCHPLPPLANLQHPKDFPPDVLDTVAAYPNICSALHMPLQSGSTANLARMRRGYTKEAYLDLVAHARATIPGVTISTDIIAGFCGETEEEHADTLDVMERVRFEQAFMFAYSKRDKTHAARHLDDDVPEATKARRLQEVIDTFRRIAVEKNRATEAGAVHLVLVEGPSTKARGGALSLTGRTDGNKRVVFPADTFLPAFDAWSTDAGGVRTPPPLHIAEGQVETADSLRGTYVAVQILDAGGTTLKGVALGRSSIADWAASGRLKAR